MQNKKYSGLLWILSFLPLVLILLCYTNLPQQVPLQWGFDGVVRYGEKKELLLIGGLSVIMGPMFLYLPRIDPRQENYKRFQRYYELLSLMTMGVLVLVTLMILSESFWPGRIVVYQAVTTLVSVLFLTLGNLLPKVKNNFFMGVRTPGPCPTRMFGTGPIACAASYFLRQDFMGYPPHCCCRKRSFFGA